MEMILALGPEGTYGHEAAEKAQDTLSHYRGGSYVNVLCSTHAEVMEDVTASQGFGVVAIENSIAGLVGEVITFWMKQEGNSPLTVVGEVELSIKHQLLVRPSVDDVGALSMVMSHPHALAQCTATLGKLGITETRSTTSTAAAAQVIAEDAAMENVGAIASSFAAETYDLKVILGDLQDSANNVTRFHILGCDPFAETGEDRTAVICWIPNKPGATVGLFRPIAETQVNMSSFHSISIGPREYAVYCEFDAHRDSPAGQEILKRMGVASTRLLTLGSFPQAR